MLFVCSCSSSFFWSSNTEKKRMGCDCSKGSEDEEFDKLNEQLLESTEDFSQAPPPPPTTTPRYIPPKPPSGWSIYLANTQQMLIDRFCLFCPSAERTQKHVTLIQSLWRKKRAKKELLLLRRRNDIRHKVALELLETEQTYLAILRSSNSACLRMN